MKIENGSICIFENREEAEEYRENGIYFKYDVYLVRALGGYQVLKCRYSFKENQIYVKPVRPTPEAGKRIREGCSGYVEPTPRRFAEDKPTHITACETPLKYLDRVRITEGFYEGYEAIIIKETLWIGRWIPRKGYLVAIVNINNTKTWVGKDELEKV